MQALGSKDIHSMKVSLDSAKCDHDSHPIQVSAQEQEHRLIISQSLEDNLPSSKTEIEDKSTRTFLEVNSPISVEDKTSTKQVEKTIGHCLQISKRKLTSSEHPSYSQQGKGKITKGHGKTGHEKSHLVKQLQTHNSTSLYRKDIRSKYTPKPTNHKKGKKHHNNQNHIRKCNTAMGNN